MNALRKKTQNQLHNEETGSDLPSTSFWLTIKNFINDPSVKKMVLLGSEVFTALQPFAEKPGITSGLKSSFLIGKSIVEHMEIWPHGYFDEEGGNWIEPFSKDFTGAILKVLKKFPYETMKTSDEGTTIHIVNMDVGKVGWLNNTKMRTFKVDRIYAESDKVEVIRTKIEKLLWEQYQGKPLVLRRNSQVLRSFDEDKVVLEIDDTFNPMPSALASEYTTYLKRAIDAEVGRSIMFYGPPGTGKSTVARTLVKSLNLRSLRIRIEDISGIDNGTIFEAVNIFKPEAVILDDFDRAHNQEQLLETLEFFQRHVKLVIATVNNRRNLDQALLRPGRFDELILVKYMDVAVIKSVLGEDNIDVFDTVKEWPIAFIQELIARRRFMSKTEAVKSLTELAQRVREMSEEDDNEDNDYQTWAAIKNKKQKRKKSKTVADAEELLAKHIAGRRLLDD